MAQVSEWQERPAVIKWGRSHSCEGRNQSKSIVYSSNFLLQCHDKNIVFAVSYAQSTNKWVNAHRMFTVNLRTPRVYGKVIYKMFTAKLYTTQIRWSYTQGDCRKAMHNVIIYCMLITTQCCLSQVYTRTKMPDNSTWPYPTTYTSDKVSRESSFYFSLIHITLSSMLFNCQKPKGTRTNLCKRWFVTNCFHCIARFAYRTKTKHKVIDSWFYIRNKCMCMIISD